MVPMKFRAVPNSWTTREKSMPRALSIRSTFAAVARQKQNPSATTRTKISASKPKKQQAKKTQRSITPSFQLGRDELEDWSTGVMKKNETRFEPRLILGGESYARYSCDFHCLPPRH